MLTHFFTFLIHPSTWLNSVDCISLLLTLHIALPQVKSSVESKMDLYPSYFGIIVIFQTCLNCVFGA